MSPIESLVALEALGPSGNFRARTPMTISDIWGEPVAALSLVPPLFVTRSVVAMRRSEALPVNERRAALTRAGEIFRTAELGGLGVEEYQRLVCRVSGMTVTAVRESTDTIADYCGAAHEYAQFARPLGAMESLEDERAKDGGALWVRRGEVFGVHAAGNHPAVHTNWLQALALGYRIAVRPSRREPFTAHRLVLALREAGFPDEHLAVLPTDHDGADAILRSVDRSIVFGGEDVIQKYKDDPRVLPQGPGRSKILITADTDWHEHIDLVVDSVSRFGGVGCVNATAVFIEGNHLGLAEAVAERLSAIPSLPPSHPEAVLPVRTKESALGMREHLREVAQGTMGVLPAEDVVHDFGDGTAVLRPALHVLSTADSPQAGIELPFPCVWVAPWSPSDGVGPLRDTLALTVLTKDRVLIGRLVGEPSVRNVYVGGHPTYWTHPAAPHDGYLADFLMESKGYVEE
ncbi:aldehyde dehydrogenase family protein [Sinomonas sp. G460-2]|uniref:aldehyde dehydrogenase family protein n=1 Tax=Sinomonas sp. G460-2 TaxID=3393464 RepID=UPI0039F0AF78